MVEQVMQDSALTPGNVLTLMNSSAKRPEMSLEVQDIIIPRGFLNYSFCFIPTLSCLANSFQF